MILVCVAQRHVDADRRPDLARLPAHRLAPGAGHGQLLQSGSAVRVEPGLRFVRDDDTVRGLFQTDHYQGAR